MYTYTYIHLTYIYTPHIKQCLPNDTNELIYKTETDSQT